MNKLLKQQEALGKLIKGFHEETTQLKDENITKTGTTARIDMLKSYWNKYFERYESLIETAAKNKDYDYFRNEEFLTTQSVYLETIASLREQFDKLSEDNSRQSKIQTASEVQLPKVNIPIFKGNYIEWNSFKDLFVSLIDSNKALGKVQKLHYLKGNLTGEAENLIRNFTITEANYDLAWNVLKERYDNPRLIIQSHLEAITSLPSASCESATEHKRILNRSLEAIKALEGLKRPVESWDDWLVFVIARKLDSATRKEWEQIVNTKNELPTFKELEKFLLNKIRVLEAIGLNKISKTNKWTVKSNVVVNNENFKINNTRCFLCGKNHFINFCFRFKKMALAERKNLVIKEKICFNYLRKGHKISTCSSAHKCYKCNELHHTLLHEDNKLPEIHNSSANDTTSAVSAYTSNYVKAPRTVLLATAYVDLLTKNGQSIRVRALLDQGSQASFVSEYCVQQLKLPKTKVDISVSGIGGTYTGKTKSLVNLTAQSTTKQHMFTCNALVLPKLTTAPVFSSKRHSNWEHLVGKGCQSRFNFGR